jgi:glutaredoxin
MKSICLQNPCLLGATLSTIATLGITLPVPALAEPSLPPAIVAQNSQTAALAAHLKKIGATMYGTYWCPTCKRQKAALGNTVQRSIKYIECDPKGVNPQPKLCDAANIQKVPTWQINGKFYQGYQSLQELARLSGFKGSTKFQ